MDDLRVNSQEYWEQRFASSDWTDNKGQEQTRYFYNLLMKMMPQWLKSSISTNQYEIVDFGCAQGQGLPILAEGLGQRICGVDFSKSAIEQAQELYPAYKFEQADIWQYSRKTDVAILSNVIEHFPTPFELVKHVAKNVQKYIVVMVPLEERNLMTEHLFTFFYSNIPLAVDKFQLIHFAEHDCTTDEEQLFLAKQILLVYSCDSAMNESLSIDQLEGLQSLRTHQTQEQERCRRMLEEAEQRIQGLQQQLHTDAESVTEQIKQLRQILWQNQAYLKALTEGGNLGVQGKIESLVSAQIEQALNRTMQAQAAHTAQVVLQQQTENHALQQENARLVALYNETDAKFLDLVQRFNSLNDAYGVVVAENVDIKRSKTYRAANLQKRIAKKLHLLGPMKFVLLARHVGIKEAARQVKARKIAESQPVETLIPTILEDPTQSSGTPMDSAEVEALHKISYRTALYTECVSRQWTEIDWEIERLLRNRTYKGIVVYPHAVHWEPMQRPQHLLRSFAKEGYLCFFCETSESGQGIFEAADNVFVVYGEENLLPALQNKCPIVLITYYLQAVFASFLRQKLIWFDILDNQEFFAEGESATAKQLWSNLTKNAKIVSYSADNLLPYIAERTDALKLNNGVVLEDFQSADTQTKRIAEFERLKATGKKIVGYYGALEEWFDVDAVRALLEQTEYEIVLIGRQGIDLSALDHPRMHKMGAVPYCELRNYSQYFDVALIPFIVNKLTNSVSPVKFYEYAAQGIPVVSSNIHEMQQYACEEVKLYHSHEELVAQVTALCDTPPNTNNLKKIAEGNTWDVRVQKVLSCLEQSVTDLQTLAGFAHDESVSVLTVTFFKYDGSTYYSGGAERYLLDLHEVCKELDIPYRVYQYGEYDWVRFYGDMEVVGLGARENDVNQYTVPLVKEMKASFARESTQAGLANIYSPFYILDEKDRVPTIGISHGISWDSEYTHFTDGNTFWQVNKNIIDAAGYCDHMISVDTNTCNWFQTLDYNTGRKIRYIPNYVDNQEFKPRADFLEERDKVIITYPRRLYGARGLYVVLEIVDDILTRYPNAEFHFVGKGFEVDTKHVEKKIEKWGDRVKWYSRSPDKMYEVYQNSDISLVPTMYSEGTSLSCLEALSSGNVVISTRVGGLTDLILSGYNGVLVEPNGVAIKEALFDLLDHPEKMKALKENAVKTAMAFSKNQWKSRWKDALKNILGDTASQRYGKPKRCMICLKTAESIEKSATLAKIKELLEAGWYVFVACKDNPLKRQSYKRLQFIDLDEDLYFEPELTIQEKDLN